eukprot:scaffold3236_cov66-Cylindrotheca_fusiformis.AAC.8
MTMLLQRNGTIVSDLCGKMDRAARIVVRDMSSAGSSTILYESNDPADISAFQETLNSCLEEPLFSSARPCLDSPVVFIYDDDDVELLRIANQRGLKSIQCSCHNTDLPLIQREKWLQWFEDRSINGPKVEVERMELQQQTRAQAYSKWMAAMPRYLRRAWKKYENTLSFDGRCPAGLRRILHKQLNGKTEEEKIADLLIWYGSTGSEPKGHPIYERVAESLLLDFHAKAIVETLSNSKKNTASVKADQRLCHGAIKLFSGAAFQKKHPNSGRWVNTLRATEPPIEAQPTGSNSTTEDNTRSSQVSLSVSS